MSKFIFVSLFFLGAPLIANASLLVNCVAKGNISAQLMIEGSSVKVQVSKNKALVHTANGGAIFNEKWNSITIDGTNQTETELNGVKIYFESSRTENKNASIRPYGSTSELLFPGNPNTIVVVGLTCNQSFQTIQNEVLSH